MYLQAVLNKYSPGNLNHATLNIAQLKNDLINWASGCYIEISNSGSRAKGTAISLASDVDYLISLVSSCNENNGGLKSIYDSLHNFLLNKYNPVKKQNVSFRILLKGLEIDITPARKHKGNTNNHWIYVSKLDTWKQTNIQKHINDISTCGRINEIKLLKIWRELNGIDFPSIYLEYLVLNILSGKPKEANKLPDNFWYVLQELSLGTGNPLNNRIVDPANSTNILSDLLTIREKGEIVSKAKDAVKQKVWENIVW